MFTKSRPILLLMVTLVLWGCASSYRASTLNGRWLHKIERQGLDFASSGVACEYSLSPRFVRLFRFSVDHQDLLLQEFDSLQTERLRVPIFLEGKSLRTEAEPGVFRNFKRVKTPTNFVPWPGLSGLWKSQSGDAQDFLVFTEWGTVYGRLLHPQDKGHLPFWAKFRLKGDGSKRRVRLWGVHGEQSLSGEREVLRMKDSQLRFRGQIFKRASQTDKLALQHPSNKEGPSVEEPPE